MTQFELYLDDDRRRGPTLTFVVLTDGDVAHRVAQRLLTESPHHRGVEVCSMGLRVFGLGSCAGPATATGSDGQRQARQDNPC